jgi:hypothetical protein
LLDRIRAGEGTLAGLRDPHLGFGARGCVVWIVLRSLRCPSYFLGKLVLSRPIDSRVATQFHLSVVAQALEGWWLYDGTKHEIDTSWLVALC